MSLLLDLGSSVIDWLQLTVCLEYVTALERWVEVTDGKGGAGLEKSTNHKFNI